MKKKLSIVLATSLAGLTLAGAGIASSIALTSCSSSEEGTSGYAMTAANLTSIFGENGIGSVLAKVPTQTPAEGKTLADAYTAYFQSETTQTSFKNAIGTAVKGLKDNVASVGVSDVTVNGSQGTVKVSITFTKDKVNLNDVKSATGYTVSSDGLTITNNTAMAFTIESKQEDSQKAPTIAAEDVTPILESIQTAFSNLTTAQAADTSYLNGTNFQGTVKNAIVAKLAGLTSNPVTITPANILNVKFTVTPAAGETPASVKVAVEFAAADKITISAASGNGYTVSGQTITFTNVLQNPTKTA